MTQPLPCSVRPRREERWRVGGGGECGIKSETDLQFISYQTLKACPPDKRVIDHFILLCERVNRLEIKYFRGIKSGYPDSSAWLCSLYSNSSVFLCLVAPNAFSGIPFWSLIPLNVSLCLLSNVSVASAVGLTGTSLIEFSTMQLDKCLLSGIKSYAITVITGSDQSLPRDTTNIPNRT